MRRVRSAKIQGPNPDWPDHVFARFSVTAYFVAILRLIVPSGLFVFMTVRLVELLLTQGSLWLIHAVVILPLLGLAAWLSPRAILRMIRAKGRCLYVEHG